MPYSKIVPTNDGADEGLEENQVNEDGSPNTKRGKQDKVTVDKKILQYQAGLSEKNSAVDEIQDVGDIFVARRFLFFSVFARHSTGGVRERLLEQKFATEKYKMFHSAFLKASMLMAAAFLVPLILRLKNEEWISFSLLAGIVLPGYVFNILLAWVWESTYLTIGSHCRKKELALIALLCAQGVVLAFLEHQKQSPRFIGPCALHLAYVNYFMPLPAKCIAVISGVVFVPTCVALSIIRYVKFLDDPAFEQWIGLHSKPSRFLEILSPIILFAMVSTLTSRRDRTTRLDFLGREQALEQCRHLKHESNKCEDLLGSMLPREIVKALKNNEPIEPQLFPEVTVIFVQVCDFAGLCSRMSPESVVQLLNVIYVELDRLSDLLCVYKVETVGDVYMAVVGCPVAIHNHADIAAHFALSAQASIHQMQDHLTSILRENRKTATGEITKIDSSCCSLVSYKARVKIRIGLNSGPIRAGVVGLDKPRFKLFGDTVNTASRMESTCQPGKIQVSESTKSNLAEGIFELADRGEIEVKGKGKLKTSYILGYVTEDDDPKRAGLSFCIHIKSIKKYRRSWTQCSADAAKMSGLAGRAKQKWSDFIYTAHQFADDTSDHSLRNSTSIGGLSKVFHQAISMRTSMMKRIELWWLMVPGEAKSEQWLKTLQRDKEEYVQSTFHSKIYSFQQITLGWQLMIAVISQLDYWLGIEDPNDLHYVVSDWVRMFIVHCVGLLSLLLIRPSTVSSPTGAQRLIIPFLVIEAVGVLLCNQWMYNHEPYVPLSFGIYILLHKICPLFQRAMLCLLVVIAYAFSTIFDYNFTELFNFAGLVFYIAFFWVLTATSIYLQEHMQHSANFHQRSAETRIATISRAKKATFQLLSSLLPSHIVPLVMEGTSPIAEPYSDVTIIFTDIKGFTAYSSQKSPGELVEFLNLMYSAFDEIIVNWGLHKVEIIGDAYFIVSGCPVPPDKEPRGRDENAVRAVEVALALLRTMPAVCDDPAVQMRVGVHSGDVIAGVVGNKGPRYQLFGETVEYANLMESTGVPGRVQISEETHQLLDEGGHDYDLEERSIERACGLKTTWLVNKSKSKEAKRIQAALAMQRFSSAENLKSPSPRPSPSPMVAPRLTTT